VTKKARRSLDYRLPVAVTEEQDSESRKKAEKCEAGEERACMQCRFAVKHSLLIDSGHTLGRERSGIWLSETISS